jgi:hypothetical protein
VEAEPAALKRERELLTKFGGQAVHTARAHAEAESLARLVADSLVADPQLVAGMVSRLRGAFDLDGVAVLRSTDSGWATEQSAGSQAAISRPEEATGAATQRPPATARRPRYPCPGRRSPHRLGQRGRRPQ